MKALTAVASIAALAAILYLAYLFGQPFFDEARAQYTPEQLEHAVTLPSGQTIVPSEEQLALMRERGESAYPYSVEVASLTCYDSMGLAKGWLRNTGTEPVAYATVQMLLDTERTEAPVIRLQPGEEASFAVPNAAKADCRVTAVRHEKDGRNLL